jgi:transcription elongation factor GreA
MRVLDKPQVVRRRSAPRHAGAPYDAVLTADGRRLLEGKVAELRSAVPTLLQAVAEDGRDELARADYEAKLAELRRLETVLAHAAPVTVQPRTDAAVGLADRIVVAFLPRSRVDDLTPDPASTEEFLLVHPFEAPLDQLRISVASPLGRAVLGREVGDIVEFDSPTGRRTVRILSRTAGC